MKINDKTFLVIYVLFFSACSNFNEVKSTSSKNHDLKVKLQKSKDKQLDLKERLAVINEIYQEISFDNLDSISLAIISQKSNIHYQIDQIDSAFIYDKSLLHGSKIIENNFYAGLSHFNIALYYKKRAEYDSAFHHYNQSKNFYLKVNDNSQVGRRYLSMAVIEQNQNDYFGSKETVTDAIRYLQSANDSKYLTSAFSVLATNHRKLLNFEEAIKYFQFAIEKSESLKDVIAYRNNLAVTYIDNKKYDKAIRILHEICKDSILKKNSSLYARVLDNLGYAKWLSGIAIEENNLQEPLKLRIKNNDQRGQIASYTHLGEFYSKTHNIKATSYFDSVIQLSKTLKIPRAEKDALKFLMKLEPKNVNLRDRYVFLQDSLYEQETKVKTQFAKYKYDDKVTQEENTRLEKENAEKELEASQQRNQKILYLGGLLFISSVLGLSLYGFRQRTKRLKQKSKTEKLEAIHETEAQLSRKLHDDHGGKLNQAMLMVQRDTDKSAILDKLESVYNQIRNFSREINAVDTGPDFWKGLKATLEYTKPTEVEMTFDGGKELDWSLVGHQTKTILFKVLQELVINMARHSKASQTVILFRNLNKELFIYYEDDGVGASKESLLRKNGLQNTEKRIQAINGSITFDSEEGKGFRAEIRIPK